jgi:hypothetical protein
MPKKNKEYYRENFSNFTEWLPWDFFVAVLHDYGFEKVNKPGSARLFVKGEIRFNAHEPHGRERFVSKYDRKRACDALERMKGEES